MVALGGRSLTRSLSQYNKKFYTVSYGCIQCLYIGAKKWINSVSVKFQVDMPDFQTKDVTLISSN